MVVSLRFERPHATLRSMGPGLAALLNRTVRLRLVSAVSALGIVGLADGYALIRLARWIGVYAALGIVGAISIVGSAWLVADLRRELGRWIDSARLGSDTPTAWLRLLARAVPVVCFVMPGLISDAIGVLLWLPIGQSMIARHVHRHYTDVSSPLREQLFVTSETSTEDER